MSTTTTTYNQSLKGWLSYAFASEVFVVVSVTLFLPICLEQFASDNGFLRPDLTEPCNTVNSSPATQSSNARCAVNIAGLWIDTASFSLYVYSISVALQALTVISMGCIADRPLYRKPLLLTFAAVGAFSAMLFLSLSSSSPLWLASALLTILSNVAFGASVVAMNAYLPSLAKDSPEVVQAYADLQSSITDDDQYEHTALAPSPDTLDQVSSPLLGRPTYPDASRSKYEATLSRATSRISSLGIASGYSAAIILLLLALVPVTRMHGSTLSLRLAICFSGIWWAVFSIPAAIWLPTATNPDQSPFQDGNGTTKADADWTFSSDIAAAWKRLAVMLRWREIKRLQHTFRYLAAWFLLSDAFTTITSTAILFGKTSLHMPPSSLMLLGILSPALGIIGSLVFPYLQRQFKWSNLQVLVLLVGMISLIPAYGCLGFLPIFSQENDNNKNKNGIGFGGLTTQGEMYGVSIFFGFAYGAFQSYARAFYAELLPPGEEARWYGLFSITDKSSSFIGPLVVGLIADSTGNIRYSFFFMVFMVWAAVPLLLSIDFEKGRQDAEDYVTQGEAER